MSRSPRPSARRSAAVAPLALAARLLQETLRFQQPPDALLADAFRGPQRVGPRLRQAVGDALYAALRAGTLDVVLDQNPDGEIRAAIAAARQVALSPGAVIHSDPIEIGIFLRDNLG